MTRAALDEAMEALKVRIWHLQQRRDVNPAVVGVLAAQCDVLAAMWTELAANEAEITRKLGLMLKAMGLELPVAGEPPMDG